MPLAYGIHGDRPPLPSARCDVADYGLGSPVLIPGDDLRTHPLAEVRASGAVVVCAELPSLSRVLVVVGSQGAR